MWDSVRTNFFGFSVPLEGKVPFMYQDKLGKVTIGIGNLIDSEQAALGLSNYGATLFHKELPGVALTVPASTDEIKTEWHAIKNAPGLASGGWQAAEPLTTLRLSDDGVRNLVAAKAAESEHYLTDGHIAEFATFQNWPGDAQLALLSMAWAMGSAFADSGAWPKFRGSVSSQDWLNAAKNCNMSNDWLAKRNAVNRGLFRNAAYSLGPPPSDPSTLLLPIPGNRPTIRLGAQDSPGSDDVNVLQTFLTWLGYTVAASGTFDSDTDRAVRAFQGDEIALPGAIGFGSVPDGIVGQLTWAALGFLVPRA